MILKGSQRGNSRELAHHLLNGDTNEHVTIHEIRGFVSDDLIGAFDEAYAISRGTRCTQFLFSLSLNPPEYADVPVGAFENAIEEIEKVLGLLDQPRAIVFHEKNGRRHCHVVWSRINAETMTALNMAHYKLKLTSVSCALYLKHGWDMPPGLKNGKDKSKMSFSLGEWQQAERLKEDPRALKAMFQDCWARSDNRKAFAQALEERGYYLARGDRRGYVAVDFEGEVYALNRWLGVKTRELKAKLGDKEDMPGVDQARTFLQDRMTEKVQRYLVELKAEADARRAPLMAQLYDVTARHRAERQDLLEDQRTRWEAETRLRSGRLSRGLRGILDRVTGKYQAVRKLNEQDAKQGLLRDNKEQRVLIARQLEERREIQKALAYYYQEHRKDVAAIKATIAGHLSTATSPPPPPARQSWRKAETPLTEQIAKIEAKIEALAGDISLLQASLESHLLPDHLKAKLRAMIEKAREALRIKYQQEVLAAEMQKAKAEKEAKDIQHKQSELFTLMQSHEKLQKRYGADHARRTANRALYDKVMAMPYKLNGVPLYEIKMTANPAVKFDEKLFVRGLRKEPARNLLRSVKVPECPVTELRQNVLQVKELLRRAKPTEHRPERKVKYNLGVNLPKSVKNLQF